MVERDYERHAREFARVTARIVVSDSGCWEWTGKCSQKQPVIHLKEPRRFYPVKRFAYEHFNQVTLPPTHIAASRCKNPKCVNPSHHTAVTRGQQSHKKFGISNPPDYCQRGHEFSVWNTGTQRHGQRTQRTCLVCLRRNARETRRRLYASGSQHEKVMRERRKDSKRALVAAMKLRCNECGESDPSCLDFHHRDPSEKDATVAEAVFGQWSDERILREIAKCDVLCANCHRKRHSLERKKTEYNLAIAETVTLVNRTSKPLTALFDGQSFVLKPGKNHGIPMVVVEYAKNQHPLMGTQDRYEFRGAQSLVGVEEWGDPVSPIEQSDALELIARDTIEDEGRTAVRGPSMKVRRSEAIVGLPTDGVAAARQ